MGPRVCVYAARVARAAFCYLRDVFIRQWVEEEGEASFEVYEAPSYNLVSCESVGNAKAFVGGERVTGFGLYRNLCVNDAIWLFADG